MDLPEVTTPADLAKRCGWSERRVRDLARRLGACRILGRRMVLTKKDVDAILEATRPAPLPRMVRPPSGWDGIPDKTMKMLLGLSPREKKPPQRRIRLPRVKKLEPPGG
jgi:hypothetical protein